MGTSEGRPHAGGDFAKSPPELVQRFGAVTAGIDGIERRQMFGYPAAFANGYMFTGLHQTNWVVRLPADALDELRSAGGRSFEPMAGRPMTGFLAFPQEMVDAGGSALLPWIERSLEYVHSLPAKEPSRKSR
jgi:TfoX/Sxy family transcriptional regulator of competence genes